MNIVLAEQGVVIPEKDFLAAKRYILNRADGHVFKMDRRVRHPSEPTQPQPELKKNALLGFVQILSGAILCIIPHPLTQSIGGGLITSGIITLTCDAADNGYKEQTNSNDMIERAKRRPIGKQMTPYKFGKS